MSLKVNLDPEEYAEEIEEINWSIYKRLNPISAPIEELFKGIESPF